MVILALNALVLSVYETSIAACEAAIVSAKAKAPFTSSSLVFVEVEPVSRPGAAAARWGRQNKI